MIEIRNLAERVVILKAIHRAIDHINSANPDRVPLEKAPGTELFGSAAALDSLGIMNLIVAVEENIKRDMNIEIVIVGDMFDIDNHPLQTVQALADHVERVVAKKKQAMQARD